MSDAATNVHDVLTNGHATNAIAQVAGHAVHGEPSIADVIFEELTDNTDHPFFHIGGFHINGFSLNFDLTKHVIMMLIAAVLVVITMLYLAHKMRDPLKRPTRLQGMLEVVVDYMRTEVLGPTVGKSKPAYLVYCLSVFFFVLYNNLIGLIPATLKFNSMDGHHILLGGTATSNLAVTGALALISFFMYNIAGMIKKGFFGYWGGLVPHGSPIWLAPILWVLELLGLFTRGFALAMRLFGNMIGGHIAIIVILFLIVMFKNWFIAPAFVLIAVVVFLIEVLVVFIQAYIFSFLTAIFISLAESEEH
ncbi:MAG: F0F1 ATP synthase subunit A [Spirochaetota bacterium]